MENKNLRKVLIAVLVGLLVFSSYALLSDSKTTASAIETSYGDIMQYDWPILGSDDYNTRFNAGPAPDQPDLLWQSKYGEIYTVFNGKAFSVSGGKLYAVDAFTGTLVWSTTLTHGGSNPNKIDDNYLFVDSTRGVAIYRISDGSYVSHLNVTDANNIGWNHPGGGSYYPGKYSSEMKMKYRLLFNTVTNESLAIGISLADPLNPRVAWTYKSDKSLEVHAAGEGKVFIGSYSGYSMIALDGMTGEFLWQAPKKGVCGYTATYYNGAVYHAGGTTHMTAYNATNGDILWDYDAGVSHWFPHAILAAYGRIYQQVILHTGRPQGVPTGLYCCWDAETGELLWQTETNYLGGYWTGAIADGKIYAMKSDAANWGGEGSTNPLGYSWAAYDAFTGSILYEVPGSASNFIVAYGNLYAGRNVIGSTTPKPWSYWRGNTDQPGIAIGQSAPTKLEVEWAFETGGAITSSPAIVDGKAYFGSYDRNWYCIDAYAGSLVWKFPIGFEASSCPAVYGGKMYTGADDGYVYCINSATGAEIWKTNIYAGAVPKVEFEIDTAQVRSSPIIIGDKLYVGALNGKVYCLNTANGQVLWTYQTNGPIGGSPAYSNGVIYIASTDRNLYALDASTSALKWKWTTPKTGTGSRQMFFVGTPVIAGDRLFIGAGGRSVSPAGPLYVCINATTGTLIWQVVTDPAGNSNNPYALTYFNGVLFGEAHMSAVAFNASNGAELWQTWIGHQVYSSPAYADDISGGKVYYGANSYSITCFNATSGVPLSWYTTEAQVYSSPAIYDGKVYVGSADGTFRCFDDRTTIPMSIYASSNKGEAMWSNETLVVKGRLLGTTVGNVWFEVGTEVPVDNSLRPGVPDATVVLSVTKPDMTSVNVTATTDKLGFFTVSYSPNAVGNYGWVTFYDGESKRALTYSAAYAEYNTVRVDAPPVESTPTPIATPVSTPVPTSTPVVTPTPMVTASPTATPTSVFSNMPLEYAAAAVVAVIVVVAVVVVFLRRKKTTQ